MKEKFKAIVAAKGEGPALSIRPLCPTRWTVRSPAIRAVLRQYGMVLSTLDEVAASHSESASRAEGLRVWLQQGNVILGLLLALVVISELEVLNTSLLKKTQTMRALTKTAWNPKETQNTFRQSLRRQKSGMTICLWSPLFHLTHIGPLTDTLGRLLHTHLNQLWIFTE